MKTLFIFLVFLTSSTFAGQNSKLSNGPRWFIVREQSGTTTTTEAKEIFYLGGGAFCLFTNVSNKTESIAKIGCYGQTKEPQFSYVKCSPTGPLKRPVTPNPPELIEITDNNQKVSLIGIYCEWERL